MKHMIATATIAVTLLSAGVAVAASDKTPAWTPARRCEGLKGPARSRCNNMNKVDLKEHKNVMQKLQDARGRFQHISKRTLEQKETARQLKERLKQMEEVVICHAGTETMTVTITQWADHQYHGDKKGPCMKKPGSSSSSTSSSSSSSSTSSSSSSAQ